MTADQAWISDHHELAATARMLYDANPVMTVENVLDFLDKPWHWQDERDAWIGAGRLTPTDPGWDLLQRRIERMTN